MTRRQLFVKGVISAQTIPDVPNNPCSVSNLPDHASQTAKPAQRFVHQRGRLQGESEGNTSVVSFGLNVFSSRNILFPLAECNRRLQGIFRVGAKKRSDSLLAHAPIFTQEKCIKRSVRKDSFRKTNGFVFTYRCGCYGRSKPRCLQCLPLPFETNGFVYAWRCE